MKRFICGWTISIVTFILSSCGSTDIYPPQADMELLSSTVQDLDSLGGEEKENRHQKYGFTTAYFVVGTARELLTAPYKQIDIQTPIAIQLHGSNATIISEHPEGAYELFTTADGEDHLAIIDPQKFWESTRFLVIMTR